MIVFIMFALLAVIGTVLILDRTEEAGQTEELFIPVQVDVTRDPRANGGTNE